MNEIVRCILNLFLQSEDSWLDKEKFFDSVSFFEQNTTLFETDLLN